jgi:DNA ligase-1
LGHKDNHRIARRRVLAWLSAAWTLATTRGTPAASSTAAREPPRLLLAREAPPGIDPSPYLVSEKFDGVRAFWDGQRLRFRSGIEVQAPAGFLLKLPAVRLDGELWLGRGRFEALSGLVRRIPGREADWRDVQFQVFELPDGTGDFASRVGQLEMIVGRAGWPQLRAVKHTRLGTAASLQERLDEVVRGGGEGLMLHRADAPYLTGRTGQLLKLKPVQDAEAVVIGHVPGRGKYFGKTGALRVRADDGREFQLGTGLSDAQRADPPAVGARVTFTHRGATGDGLPRFASFLRVRDDL